MSRFAIIVWTVRSFIFFDARHTVFCLAFSALIGVSEIVTAQGAGYVGLHFGRNYLSVGNQ